MKSVVDVTVYTMVVAIAALGGGRGETVESGRADVRKGKKHTQEKIGAVWRKAGEDGRGVLERKNTRCVDVLEDHRHYDNVT
jgi:hypothetical protein